MTKVRKNLGKLPGHLGRLRQEGLSHLAKSLVGSELEFSLSTGRGAGHSGPGERGDMEHLERLGICYLESTCHCKRGS